MEKNSVFQTEVLFVPSFVFHFLFNGGSYFFFPPALSHSHGHSQQTMIGMLPLSLSTFWGLQGMCPDPMSPWFSADITPELSLHCSPAGPQDLPVHLSWALGHWALWHWALGTWASTTGSLGYLGTGHHAFRPHTLGTWASDTRAPGTRALGTQQWQLG